MRRRPAGQLALVGEGLLADDAPVEDLLALWVVRVADYDVAAAEILARRGADAPV